MSSLSFRCLSQAALSSYIPMIRNLRVKKMRQRLKLVTAWGLAVGWLMFSPAVMATTLCVNTVASFQGALSTWAAMNGGDMTIKLVKNTYALTVNGFTVNNTGTSLSILGGYTANCTNRTVDPTNTTIDGQNFYNVRFNLATQNDVTIEGITFTGLKRSFDLYFDDYQNGSGHVFNVRYNIFRDFQADSGDPNVSAGVEIHGKPHSGGVDVHFQNNLVYNVSATGGLPALKVTSRDNGFISMTSNTIAGIGSGIAAAVNFYTPGSAGAAFLENNIFFNGSQTSLDFSNGDVGPFASYNLLGNVAANVNQGANTFAANFNNNFGDPLFQNTGIHDYHLASNAFLSVNTGGPSSLNPDGLPGHDLDGNKRVVGSAIDRGAYESAVDDLNNFTVTSTLDAAHSTTPNVSCAVNSGTCTLREAIIGANANAGASLISFNLPCQSLLSLSSALPDITTNITIDGYTNPGSVPNTTTTGFNATLCVYLHGQGSIADGLHTSGGGRLTVRGLAIGGFTDAGIRLDVGSGHSIGGNQIGNAFGTNGKGIYISGTSTLSFVGGYDDPAVVNLIGGNTGYGVYVDAASGQNTIANNLIGLNSGGISQAANQNSGGVGIFNSPKNTVYYNTISGNTLSGVAISGASAQGNGVSYNTIGYNTDGSAASNGDPAVLLNFGAMNNSIGASQNGTSGGNTIYSTAKGVWVSTSGGAGNRIVANRISAGAGSLGIDLDAAGATANNSSGSANHLQNFPVVTNAFRTHTTEWIETTVDAAAGVAFRIDYYWGFCCSGGPGAPPRGIPDNYVGMGTSGTTDVNGHAHFWTKLGVPTINNQTLSLGLISATATASDGSTSEIGPYVLESTDLIFRDDF